VIVTVQTVDDVLPRADGRQWSAEQYEERDGVLRALGVPVFRQRPTRLR
jgi:hypothetical protein